jgi:7-cyano-7-deazaguanine synthase
VARKIGVLFSGGLDSAALIGHFLDQGYIVHPIYIHAGLRWEKAELFWVKKYLRAIRRPALKPLAIVSLLLENAYAKNWSHSGKTPGARSSDRAVFLPARNLLLITKALLHLHMQNVSTLALATLDGNPFPDGEKSYFRALGKILTRSFMRPIKILSPFRNLSKQEVIHRNKKWPLHLSFSCINPRGVRPCGRCNKCAERIRALREENLIAE